MELQILFQTNLECNFIFCYSNVITDFKLGSSLLFSLLKSIHVQVNTVNRLHFNSFVKSIVVFIHYIILFIKYMFWYWSHVFVNFFYSFNKSFSSNRFYFIVCLDKIILELLFHWSIIKFAASFDPCFVWFLIIFIYVFFE